jgi:predicted nucleotide-binding protein
MYTLLVTGTASEQGRGVFPIEGSRFLEFTDELIVNKLGPLTAEAIQLLREWPCILMDEGRADERVRVGRITHASRSGRNVELTFEPLALKAVVPLTNGEVWRLRRALDIEDFEFARNHVAVKDVDALSVLRVAGFTIRDGLTTLETTNDSAPGRFAAETEPAPVDHTSTVKAALSASRSPNRVFVVHGRNEAARASVVEHLRRLGLEPIVLHDQPNMGRHLLTKLIQEAELVTFAVVIMTDDDVGGASRASLSPRARQNVILELGYFIAHLGQARVCALITPGLETPSDFDGIVYIRMDSDDRWRRELTRELQAAEMPITVDARVGTV